MRGSETHFPVPARIQSPILRCGGKDCRSLSGIARELTGTSVNGFVWFKLIGRKGAVAKGETPLTD